MSSKYLLSRRSRHRERLHATGMSICSSVCLSVWLLVCLSPNCKKAIFSKTKQFRAMVSIDDLQEIVHRLFKEPVIRPLKSKMAEIRHIGSWRQNAKTRFSGKKTKQFRAMVSIDDLSEVVHGLFKEPIIGPLKSKMPEIGHFGSWRQHPKRRFFLKK